MKKPCYQLGILLLFFFIGCNKKQPATTQENILEAPPLFTLLGAETTNIHFQNTLEESLNANVLMYEYLYNGAGVATGDFNNDGLIDMYFTSNMGENKFYINHGDMHFEDITAISKTSGRKGPWKTGITAADVNGDGLLDLYLCYSGALPMQKRQNQLFINLGVDANNNPVFEEKAAAYGLDSPAFSNQGYFLDYDHDGDLDMLLLNHNPKSMPILNEVSTAEYLKKDDQMQGVRLFQQSNGVFNDVTTKSGISGSSLTYGLGIGISDLDNDGWVDFYVSNDYTIPDYLYINNKNGTFTNRLKEQLGHTSHFSMGNDIADVNNDGLADIFTLDMLPESNRRQKLLLSPDNYEKFDLNLRSGFHYQYMRNMLQLNHGNGTFSEIGQIAGISNTDWSWAPLLADFDNDGFKDLFVTNGYFRDYTNLDFINYMEDYVASKGRLQRTDVLKIIEKMPSSNLTNYLFSNTNGTNFSNATKTFGLDQPANSSGAAYADFDNDGDLDLVVNNINKPAFIYRNESQKEKLNYLKVQLKGAAANTNGFGSKVTLHYAGKTQSLEQSPARGYLSSVSPILHFGLEKISKIDSVHVRWNAGLQETISVVKPNTLLVLDEKDALKKHERKEIINPLLIETKSPITYNNEPAIFNDFKRQSLLISQLSHSGPCMTKGDLNNDGLEDFIVGGSKGHSAKIFIQGKSGRFKELNSSDFELDKDSHDTDIQIFDSNNDGHQDIYIASGGYHDYESADIRLQDRIYLGNGQGDFSKNTKALPKLYSSTSTVAISDINNDNNLDLFVGARVIPGRYPESPESSILINDGQGNFTNQTKNIAPKLEKFGMVTDAIWSDVNGDAINDLVIVGEWLPLAIFINSDGKLKNKTSYYLEKSLNGWWNTIATADFNDDGKPDFIIGNMGTNTQFNVSENQPAELYFSDFDQNGSVDPIFNYYIEGKSYPYLTRDELLGQLAGMRSKFTSYESYADATIQDIFNQDELNNAEKLAANHMKTTLLLSNTNGGYSIAELPEQSQYSPIHNISISDFNHDGNHDILLLGNNAHFKLRLGKFDANYGTLLEGDGTGNFRYINQTASGLDIRGDVRSSIIINDKLLLGIYGKPLKTYTLSNKLEK